MNKTASQSRENAELARAFRRPWRASHMRMEQICAPAACKFSGIRMGAAMRKLVRAEQRVVLFMEIVEKQRAKAERMPSLLEHSGGLGERHQNNSNGKILRPERDT